MWTVFITGFAGTGKTTTCEALANRGYAAYDMEDEGLFTMVDGETGEEMIDFDPTDPVAVETGQWICDTEQLQAHMQAVDASVPFYGAIGSNTEELLPLFDEIILLTADMEEIRERLGTRPPGGYGREPAIQDQILEGKDGFEEWMRSEGATVVRTDRSIDETIAEILSTVQQ